MELYLSTDGAWQWTRVTGFCALRDKLRGSEGLQNMQGTEKVQLCSHKMTG